MAIERIDARQDERQERERAKAVELAVGQIEKQFGKGSIMRLGGKGAIQPIDSIPTGAISIDYALGIGGVPRGRVIEIFGPESSGKMMRIVNEYLGRFGASSRPAILGENCARFYGL